MDCFDAQWVQWLATFLLGAAVALVAYRQWRTAHEQVILDLFEKRFDLYNRAMIQIGAVVSSGEARQENLREVAGCIEAAQFLFGGDGLDYFRSIHVKMHALGNAKIFLDHANANQRVAAVDKRAAAFAEVEKLFSEVPVRLLPFMRMHQRRRGSNHPATTATFPPARLYGRPKIMTASKKVDQKKRGRPATGRHPVVSARMPGELQRRVEEWALQQEDQPHISEAIRRLVERALAAGAAKESVKAQPNRTAAEGDEFAAAAAHEQIDKAQAHEKPGTGRRRRKKALTEIPAELLGRPAKRK